MLENFPRVDNEGSSKQEATQQVDVNEGRDSSGENEPETWGKIKNFIHVAVAAIVLNLATPGTGEAAPGVNDIQTLKNTIEASKIVSYKIEKELIDLVSAKGTPGTIGDQPVKMLKSGNSWTIEVGYSKDRAVAEWTVIESPDGSVALLDKDNDGLLDRYILNDKTEKPWIKSLDNRLYLFSGVKSLDETFPTEVELAKDTPEGKNKVEIGIFTNKNNTTSFHSYDKQSGEIFDDSTAFSYKFAYDMQSRFYSALKESVNNNK